ncbi:hypothetical protein [uncultured Mediterranean phage uvDeep-CGR2-KM24-C165]|jgi:hypothetical protein|nr:hypothetical protein [uncultured Mediterranean phage uvDeep-CGR2-KM24-C165]BAR39576.1 hypothetical protein [uncultured Mediterranean phage uvMED]|tara:strand:+ start:290 stop:445 length:156 start_codon:yes stop_codon:yes gene_type:complete
MARKTKKKKEINPNVLRALGIEVLVDKKYKKQAEQSLNNHLLKKARQGYFN